jgi:hypothetical protein
VKTNYLPVATSLALSNGQVKRWLFQPQTLLIDEQTEYIVGMHLQYSDGSYCNLLLHPQNASQTEFLRFAGNLLAAAGSKLIAGQIQTGNAIVDNICSAFIGRELKREFTKLLETAIQSRSSYFAIDNGEKVVIQPISAYDLSNI